MRCGLVRRSSSLSRRSSQSSSTSSSLGPLSRKRQLNAELSSSTSRSSGGSFLQKTSGSLSIALRASKKQKRKSSFLGGSKGVDGKEMSGVYKTVQLGHVIFNSQTTSQSGFGSFSNSNHGNSNTQTGKRKQGPSTASLFSKVSGVTKQQNGCYLHENLYHLLKHNKTIKDNSYVSLKNIKSYELKERARNFMNFYTCISESLIY